MAGRVLWDGTGTRPTSRCRCAQAWSTDAGEPGLALAPGCVDPGATLTLGPFPRPLCGTEPRGRDRLGETPGEASFSPTGESHPSGEGFWRNPRGWGSQERAERPASSVGDRTGAQRSQRSGDGSGCHPSQVRPERSCKPARGTQRRVLTPCDFGALLLLVSSVKWHHFPV